MAGEIAGAVGAGNGVASYGALKMWPGAWIVSEKSGRSGAFGVSDGALLETLSFSGADKKRRCPPLATLWASAGDTAAIMTAASSRRHFRFAKLEPISIDSLLSWTFRVKNYSNRIGEWLDRQMGCAICPGDSTVRQFNPKTEMGSAPALGCGWTRLASSTSRETAQNVRSFSVRSRFSAGARKTARAARALPIPLRFASLTGCQFTGVHIRPC